MDIAALLPIAVRAAEAACQAIMEVYHSNDFQTEEKGDHSPLTIADKKAHQVIISHLSETPWPVLSEEGKEIPFEVRKSWEYFWMVDPLDGTKEFIKRNGEFTVNIALIHHDTPVLGVVSIPVTNETYYAASGHGVYKKEGTKTMRVNHQTKTLRNTPGIRVVASRSHLTPETDNFIKLLNQPVLVSKGSSLKFMMLVEGEADIYPRFAPTMEWDTAAAHAIVKEAGFHVLQAETQTELIYNKPNLLNPSFVVSK
jgi:3'(2'), 5'-bisphosphate nucleotidase